MAFTTDPATDVGLVRLLAQDNNQAAAIYPDDAQIQAFLALTSGTNETAHIKRAAALALLTTANNQTLVLKKVKLLDLDVDGTVLAAELRQAAALLNEQAHQDEANDGANFDYAEFADDAFQRRELLYKRFLRGGF